MSNFQMIQPSLEDCISALRETYSAITSIRIVAGRLGDKNSNLLNEACTEIEDNALAFIRGQVVEHLCGVGIEVCGFPYYCLHECDEGESND